MSTTSKSSSSATGGATSTSQPTTTNPTNQTFHKMAPCLIELKFGISLDAVLLAHAEPSLESVQIIMNDTKTVIHGGLYDFIRDSKNVTKIKQTKKYYNPIVLATQLQDLYQRLSPILPKTFNIKIEMAHIAAITENSSEDFSAKLQSFTVFILIY